MIPDLNMQKNQTLAQSCFDSIFVLMWKIFKKKYPGVIFHLNKLTWHGSWNKPGILTQACSHFSFDLKLFLDPPQPEYWNSTHSLTSCLEEEAVPAPLRSRSSFSVCSEYSDFQICLNIYLHLHSLVEIFIWFLGHKYILTFICGFQKKFHVNIWICSNIWLFLDK